MSGLAKLGTTGGDTIPQPSGEGHSLKVNQVPYEFPSDLETALVDFVSYYNFRRYHIALGNVTPADVIQGRPAQILHHRKEVKLKPFNTEEATIRPSGSLTAPLDHAQVFGLKSVPFR